MICVGSPSPARLSRLLGASGSAGAAAATFTDDLATLGVAVRGHRADRPGHRAGFGLNVGLTHQHPTGAGTHLLNESTSWSIALGVIMVGAALWPSAAAGLAGVLTAFVAILTGYVIVDALSGAVSTTRILTHLPVVIGAVLAIMVWRSASGPRPRPDAVAAEPDIVLPDNASRGRRRGHLWPTDGSAA